MRKSDFPTQQFKIMKLITLNTWGGRIYRPFLEFLNKNKDVDIFCFQEIFHNLDEKTSTASLTASSAACEKLFNNIKEILKNHEGYFCPVHGASYGLATFVKKNIKIAEVGDVLLYKNEDFDPDDDFSDHDRKLQWLKILHDDKDIIIMNVHGHWTGKSKEDNPARIQQSKEITSLLENFKGLPRILCGDFNLRPDTESIRMLEEGMTNLITKNGITSTRTSLYSKSEKFADYIFTSSEVKVIDFKILPDEVSDHTPLLLEFK